MRWLGVAALVILFGLPALVRAEVTVAPHHASATVTSIPLPRPRIRLAVAEMAPSVTTVAIPSEVVGLMMQLLEIVSVVGAIMWNVFRLGGKIQGIEGNTSAMQSDISELKGGILKLDAVVTEMAVTAKRMDMMDVRLDDIVKGRVRIDGVAHRGRK